MKPTDTEETSSALTPHGNHGDSGVSLTTGGSGEGTDTGTAEASALTDPGSGFRPLCESLCGHLCFDLFGLFHCHSVLISASVCLSLSSLPSPSLLPPSLCLSPLTLFSPQRCVILCLFSTLNPGSGFRPLRESLCGHPCFGLFGLFHCHSVLLSVSVCLSVCLSVCPSLPFSLHHCVSLH